jgi:hypothetical protein
MKVFGTYTFLNISLYRHTEVVGYIITEIPY